MTDQKRSRRIMLVIGAIALIALAAPWVWRSWQEHTMRNSSNDQLEVYTTQSSQDLAMCLLKRGPDGVALDIFSENNFYNAERDLFVAIVPAADRHELHPSYHGLVVLAGRPAGKTLNAAEISRVKSCAKSSHPTK